MQGHAFIEVFVDFIKVVCRRIYVLFMLTVGRHVQDGGSKNILGCKTVFSSRLEWVKESAIQGYTTSEGLEHISKVVHGWCPCETWTGNRDSTPRV